PDSVRAKQGCALRMVGAPVVADNDGCGNAERIQHANDVPDDVKRRIELCFDGRVTVAKAAHVERDGAVSCIGHSLHLTAPGGGGIRKSVTEQNRRTAALLENAERLAIDVDQPALKRKVAAYCTDRGCSRAAKTDAQP